MNQIEKNTVSAKGQLKESEFVTFLSPNGGGKRYLFVGNSITRHGMAPKIGWNRDCGMAASSVENDYVHLLAKKIREKEPTAAFCICQVADWERNYKNPDAVMHLFQNAREFQADVIIMRCVENCAATDFDEELFEKNYALLAEFFNPNGTAQTVFTSGFWKHPGDGKIEKTAKQKGMPFLYLGELGEDDNMKAIGQFEHFGVANHPGDLGMKTIADMIWKYLQ